MVNFEKFKIKYPHYKQGQEKRHFKAEQRSNLFKISRFPHSFRVRNDVGF